MGWGGILRLGLVQASLGAVLILTTATLNRVMVVELALPATVPGLLVAIHHAVQMLRPRLGHASDAGRRRTPFILGGMAVLGLGATLAAAAVAIMHTALAPGLALAGLGFLLVGLGVGAAGTSLLALLATAVTPERRAPAAVLVWVMMIAGFAVTATLAGRWLDPFTPWRLVEVTGGVAMAAMAVTAAALWRLEAGHLGAGHLGAGHLEAGHLGAGHPPSPAAEPLPFRASLREVWAEPASRRFTVFVFVSMLAYSAADLVLEPFAGEVWGFSIGESTRLAGLQNAGTLAGMALVALFGSGLLGAPLASLRGWMVGGCVASAAILALLAASPALPDFPLPLGFAALGLANGAFAAAAIATMMALAGRQRTGTRMGLWGAAQAMAFAIGGFAGTAVCDVARWLLGAAAPAYASVFAVEAALFLVSAVLAARLAAPAPHSRHARRREALA